ncbi:MAG: HNH endonuclease [Gammaproteobacteria bacterium]|nr:HNH endonuclease [Gammaproteobacteria bacterium]MBU1447834.1 HNH endonuclease [Gammaproteobacteria bacterium]
MPSQIARHRHSSFVNQSGRCFYCGHPMWESDISTFAESHKLSLRQARIYRCTAEHLVAKIDGGSNSAKNIVAACHWCNKNRHARKKAPTPIEYMEFIKKRLAQGRWLNDSPALASQRLVNPIPSRT